MISGKSEIIEQIFNKLLESNPDIKGFILVSYEGLVMVSSFKTGTVDETIAAMTAGIDSLMARFLQDLKWDYYTNIVLFSPEEYFLIKNIEGIGLLVTITKSDIIWKKIASHVSYAISKIKSLDESDF